MPLAGDVPRLRTTGCVSSGSRVWGPGVESAAADGIGGGGGGGGGIACFAWLAAAAAGLILLALVGLCTFAVGNSSGMPGGGSLPVMARLSMPIRPDVDRLKTSMSISWRFGTTHSTRSSCSVSIRPASLALASAKDRLWHGRSSGRFIFIPKPVRDLTQSAAGRCVRSTSAFGLAHQRSRNDSADGRSTSAPTEGGTR